MGNPRLGTSRAAALTLTLALATVGIALAQDSAPAKTPAKNGQDVSKEKDKTPAKPKGKARRGGLLAPGGPKAKEGNKADPLAKPADAASTPAPGTFPCDRKPAAAEGTA